MKILTDLARVKHLLEKHEHLRNDDYKLIATLFRMDIREKLNQDPNKALAMDFFKLYASEKATNAQSVIRIRCKLQVEFPHLRGNVWYKRHDEQPRVIKDLNTIKNK